MSKVDYPTTLDEIDQWLFDSFGILPGCCSSIESVKHTTARMVAEALWPKAEKDLGWISVKDRLPEVGHFVLTCVSDAGTPQCVGMAILLDDGTWWDGDMKVCVDYWMEVPKLKEEKK